MVHEILDSLPDGARVLDLGCRTGSFVPPPRLRTVRLDVERPQAAAGAWAVQADAVRIPFETGAFDAVISNHSLEHFLQLDDVLREIRRILRPVGAFYAAVPDAATVTDRLYRWIAHGGGHVNRFTDAGALARRIESAVGLPFSGGRTLYTSLSFLHRRALPAGGSRKLWLFGNGSERCLRTLNAGLRLVDAAFETRASVYGWALYFGTIPRPVETRGWVNVCVGCGGGYAEEELRAGGAVRRGALWATFTCPGCGSRSPFFPEAWFAGRVNRPANG